MAQLGELSITNVAWVRVRLGVMWVEFVAGSRPCYEGSLIYVSVNPKCTAREYSYLIKLQLLEDRFPINARMTEYAIEKNRKD